MYDYTEVSKKLNTDTRDKDEILKNRDLEYSITSVRRERLEQNPIQGNYDFHHLSKIHEKLFEKLYDFAGKKRDFNFSKGLIHNQQDKYRGDFADHTLIDDLITNASKEIQKNNEFKDCKTTEEFVDKITPIYAKFNEAHPFEEGNGRAIKTLFNQLAHNAGFHIDFDKSNAKDWNFASLKSVNHAQLIESMRELVTKPRTNEFLKQEFEKITSKKELKQENELEEVQNEIYRQVKDAKIVKARPGETSGPIVMESNNLIVQQLGKESKFFMIHEKKSFEKIPSVGSNVKIKQTSQGATVSNLNISNEKTFKR